MNMISFQLLTFSLEKYHYNHFYHNYSETKEVQIYTFSLCCRNEGRTKLQRFSFDAQVCMARLLSIFEDNFRVAHTELSPDNDLNLLFALDKIKERYSDIHFSVFDLLVEHNKDYVSLICTVLTALNCLVPLPSSLFICAIL